MTNESAYVEEPRLVCACCSVDLGRGAGLLDFDGVVRCPDCHHSARSSQQHRAGQHKPGAWPFVCPDCAGVRCLNEPERSTLPLTELDRKERYRLIRSILRVELNDAYDALGSAIDGAAPYLHAKGEYDRIYELYMLAVAQADRVGSL